MIRNKSPPGVCWLTVRAGSGILKYHSNLSPPAPVLMLPHFTGGSRRTVQLDLLTFLDKEISKKFSQNFTTFSPTL